METSKKSGPAGRFLARFLLFDLLTDKQSRPVLIYVAVSALVGAVIYHFIEGWGWLDSLYFVVITTTTIGYGDLAPKTSLGKFVTIFFALNGVAILVALLDQIRQVRTNEVSRVRETHGAKADGKGEDSENHTPTN
jgi:voltage-gated potassium channel